MQPTSEPMRRKKWRRRVREPHACVVTIWDQRNPRRASGCYSSSDFLNKNCVPPFSRSAG
jgi:hypothetical protein